MFQIQSWPSCVLHLDADSFFASVEQAINPVYRGKPCMVGAERGIAIAVSVEAKRLGVKRGMTVWDIQKRWPQVIRLPSNFENYLIFSQKMFRIMKRYSPMTEEYSIDEGFMDLRGLRKVFRGSYVKIAEMMKEEIERDLGITVSVGISLTKSLAKLCSKRNKPSGVCSVNGREIEGLLSTTSLDKIWGFGNQTQSLLNKLGIYSPLDYVRKDESFIKKYFHKPGLEIYHELRGDSIYRVNPQAKQSYQSISKTKTFMPASRDRDFIFSELITNLERACLKARKYKLYTHKIYIFLKTQSYKKYYEEVKLEIPTNSELDLIQKVKAMFDQVFNPHFIYRSTGVILADLKENDEIQLSLFENRLSSLEHRKVSQTMDNINLKLGRNKIHLADSLMSRKFSKSTNPIKSRKSIGRLWVK